MRSFEHNKAPFKSFLYYLEWSIWPIIMHFKYNT